ncbi:SMP-30/gluconolactonase/LRE family protein [Nocardioides rubriscoriae]|uniref:SMP-30/gluconolactonase/LRE family protein n=1 Tax=Nocardioides rubriscoriae TaxID=642762 RepID=UPI0011DF5893|nr:SMP-30/gluconolactonase/LRE family protein [Nocardioides rubriscoriae]
MVNILLQSVVALLAAGLGVSALAGVGPVRELGLRRRLVRWPWGVLVTLSGVGLLVGNRVPFVTFFAASLLVLTLVPVLVASVVRRPSAGARGPVALLGLAAAAVGLGVLQPLGLKVLLLPHPDDLPYDPVAASRVVSTFDDGMWFEGIEQGPDGTLYLAESTGEDYARGDKSDVEAQVIARATDGSQRSFFTLPTGSTAGVMAVADDGTLYLSVTGGLQGLWQVDATGEGRLLAPLPDDSFPNGVTLSQDGRTAYVADSALGTVWRVDTASGETERAYEGDVLRARRFVALPPGANGIHLVGEHAYVTNSDSGELLRFTIDSRGDLHDPEVLVRGVPADDFAVDEDGTIYLTTHIYNTVVRVTPDGRRSVVADERQDVTGATDCVLVTGPDGTRTLYVVTDGGALATGDQDAAGTLVALDLRS